MAVLPQERGSTRTRTDALALRATLVALALPLTLVGLWIALAPVSFYEEFPLVASWVDGLPPYNEHLIRDYGVMQLGFAVLFWWAAARPTRALVVPVCVASIVWSAGHFAFHAFHLEPFGRADAIGQMLALAGQVALPVLAIALARR